MSVDERARHELHARLDELLGPEPAGTLMSYLPPVGWADVATKRDLDALADGLQHRFEATLYRELSAQTRTFLFWTSGLLVTLAGMAFAASRLV